MTDEELYIETLQPDYRKPGAKLVQQLTESDTARQERDQLRKVVDELAYELKDLRELILDRFEIKLNLYNSLPHVQQRSKK